jgi:prefoldin subunit 5
MSEHMLTQEQIIQLFSQLAQLNTRIEELSRRVKEQESSIEELVALANKGKGSVWILMAIGGLIGAMMANIKTLLALVIR